VWDLNAKLQGGWVCVFNTSVPITKLFVCVWGETMEDMY
jgi:hypothetical protein